MRVLLTGGTGFLGGHVAEAATAAGYRLRALVRRGSDATHLRALCAELVEGDLGDGPSLTAAAGGCQAVIHAAAKVGDWGRRDEFDEPIVAGTRRMLAAAAAAGVARFVHVSSVAVYGKRLPRLGRVVESQGPLPPERIERWYRYGRAKAAAEREALDAHAGGRLAVSVLRPGWIYGPRDRTSMPRLLSMIERGSARVVGDGTNLLGLSYAANVADAAVLAVGRPEAAGEALNVVDDPLLTQREFLNLLADALDAPRVRARVPLRAAVGVAVALELACRVGVARRRPLVTRQAVMLVGLPGEFATDKIRRLLGWTPRVGVHDGVAATVGWWRGDPAGRGRGAALRATGA